MQTRITITLSAREWQGLQRLSSDAMRTPKGQLRWLLRQELLRRGLSEHLSESLAGEAEEAGRETD
jgi:hypothetical protein